jgi:hypothetical protein
MSAQQSSESPSGRSSGSGNEPARRSFLRAMGGLPAVAAVGGMPASPSVASVTEPEQTLPQIPLGSYSISRVICGANCFNGGSHLSVFVNRAMREYYTEDQIFRTLTRCQQVGINCWQDGLGNLDMYGRFAERGLQMRYIALAAGDPANIQRLKQGGCVAIAHHGEVTDQMFKRGELDRAHDFLKQIRDAGLVVGVSTHMPDVVDAVESKGWDVDFYMTCVYERHRSKEELERLLGQAPIPVGEVYLPEDPPRMFQAMQQTRRTCLAFKILAAGRLSDRRQWVENAFRQTFAAIKPNDGVIVGIYDRYSDQPAECADYARQFGHLSRSATT